jgi:carboxymethylenebutenolidase
MSLESKWVHYGPEGAFSGLLTWPERAAAPLPAVVVIQEAWGVDAHIQDVARRIALAGYAAFAPDVFSRNGVRPPPLSPERLAETVAFLNDLPLAARMDPKARETELHKRPQAEVDRIGETLRTLFAGGFLPPVVAAAAYLRAEQPVTRGQKVASVGFCMGGGLSVLLACNDPELAGAIIFYGRPPPFEDVPRIRCPVLAFYGTEDKPLIDGLPAFADAMKEHGKSFESVMYDGAEHAFFNDTRPLYDVRAARDAFVRMLQFFRRTLA